MPCSACVDPGRKYWAPVKKTTTILLGKPIERKVRKTIFKSSKSSFSAPSKKRFILGRR